MATKTYRVGNANDPQHSDPHRRDEASAIELAKHLAKQDFYQPVAVWDEEEKIVHLFLCGQQFRSV